MKYRRHPGSVAEKARFGRITVKEAARYVDDDPDGFVEAMAHVRTATMEHRRSFWVETVNTALRATWEKTGQRDEKRKERWLLMINKRLSACWNNGAIDYTRLTKVLNQAAQKYLGAEGGSRA